MNGTLMQRMTDVLSQMLNDPVTRAALSAASEEAASQNNEESATTNAEENSETTSTRDTGETASSSEATSSGATGSQCVSRLYNHLSTLRNLREGFIEQHGQEPSLSLRYSQQSTANASVSLNVVDEISQARVDTLSTNKSVPSTSQTSNKRSSARLDDETVSRLAFDKFSIDITRKS